MCEEALVLLGKETITAVVPVSGACDGIMLRGQVRDVEHESRNAPLGSRVPSSWFELLLFCVGRLSGGTGGGDCTIRHTVAYFNARM